MKMSHETTGLELRGHFLLEFDVGCMRFRIACFAETLSPD